MEQNKTVKCEPGVYHNISWWDLERLMEKKNHIYGYVKNISKNVRLVCE